MRRFTRCLYRYRRWLPGVLIAAQVGGCLPDNAVRSVLGEQILQSFAIGASGLTSLFFGLPDLILNSLVLGGLANLAGS